MAPMKSCRPVPKKSSLRQKKADTPKSSPRKGEASLPERPGRCVSTSFAKCMQPSMSLLASPNAAKKHRAPSKCSKSSQFSRVSSQPPGRFSLVKANKHHGRTQLPEKKRLQSPKPRTRPDERERKPLRGKKSVYSPQDPVNFSGRRTRYAQGAYPHAGAVVNAEHVSGQKGRRRARTNADTAEQEDAHAVFASRNLEKRSVASPQRNSQAEVRAKKFSAKPSHSAPSAAKKASFIASVESDGWAVGPPKTSAASPLTALRGNVLKPTLPHPNSAKDVPLRAVSVPTRPVESAKHKCPLPCLQGVAKEVGVQHPGWRRGPRSPTVGAYVLPAVIRGSVHQQHGRKFDPFKPPSTALGDGVGVSDSSFMTPPIVEVPPRQKLRNKRLSSFPGLHSSPETSDNAQKLAVPASTGRDQIAAMQGVAGFCVFAIVIATTLFIVHFISWSLENREESICTPAIGNDATNESNHSLPIFPLYVGSKRMDPMASEGPN